MISQTTPKLAELLEKSTARHKHICPRQVIGVRMGLQAASLLELDLPQTNKRLLTFIETDGCFADGVAVATGCWLGRRTMRLMDYGKVAATFVDSQTGRAVRIWPHADSRSRANAYAPDAKSRWHTMLAAYQVMPTAELLCWQRVELTVSLKAIISRAGVRVNCQTCGEEIINEREVLTDGQVRCRSCAGDSYYQFTPINALASGTDVCS
jgi:formylmethanofuran dehydrogenase subunit E